MSKILEKAVLSQLFSFLTNNNVLDNFQSGFRVHHNSETALLNDLLLFVHSGNCSVFLLLDFSAVFDSVNNDILPGSPPARDWYPGCCSTVVQLLFIKIELSPVSIGNISSSSAAITCGLPQDSILGFLFFLYMLVES